MISMNGEPKKILLSMKSCVNCLKGPAMVDRRIDAHCESRTERGASLVNWR